MNYTRLLIAFAWLLALCARPAAAAPDAPAGWNSAVETFVTALVDRVPAESIESTFQERHSIRDLDRKEASLAQLSTLSTNVDWARPLSYRDMPDTLATDISALVVDSPLSNSIKQYLTPDGELTTRQANVTAMKWISQTLRARQDQPIGVVLMHKPAAEADAAGSLVVVLLAGERVGIDSYRIKQVAFGEFNCRR